MNQQEYFIKLQTLEQEANYLGEQLKVIDEQIGEMNQLKNDLKTLKNSSEQEIFADLGQGIFVKAKLEKSDFLVDVGNKVFVPKNHEEINQVVDDQIGKFNEVKEQASSRISEINQDLNKLIDDAKNLKQSDKEKNKGKNKDNKENSEKNK
jgi:prefoldin alpha subunit